MSYMKYKDASIYHHKARIDSKIVTIDAILLSESEKAYLIDTGETDSKGKPIGKWIPKSISEYDKSDNTIQIEEWFALKEKLV